MNDINVPGNYADALNFLRRENWFPEVGARVPGLYGLGPTNPLHGVCFLVPKTGEKADCVVVYATIAQVRDSIRETFPAAPGQTIVWDAELHDDTDAPDKKYLVAVKARYEPIPVETN
jgi:hypothetical protein